MTFGIRKASLENINRKEQEDEKTSENMRDSFVFLGETEDQKFIKELDDDLPTDFEHKKNRSSLCWTLGSRHRNHWGRNKKRRRRF